MQIKKNRSGYYELRWTEEGRSRTVSARTKNLVEAKTFAREFFEHERLVAKVVAAPSVGEIVRDYLAVRPSQEWNLRAVLRELGGYSVLEIDPDIVRSYTTTRMNAGVSSGTIRRELGALVAALNRAVKTKLVRREDVPFVDLPPAGAPRIVFMDDAVERAFYGHAMMDSAGAPRATRLTRFVALALDTGARKAAIEGLTWDRVDLTKGLIDFRDSGVSVSRKRRVVVPISSRLRPTLLRAWSERVSDYVLDHPGNIRRAFETWVAGSPAPDIHIHDLRRTWASLAVLAGVDVVFVAAVLGDDVRTVMKHYAHLRPGHLQGAVDARWSVGK